jgi:hypothetical protein
MKNAGFEPAFFYGGDWDMFGGMWDFLGGLGRRS